MSFVSPLFVLGIFLAALGYRVIPAAKRPTYLLVMSYLYYATWSVAFAGLMLAATVFAYELAIRIESDRDREKRSKYWLAVAIVGLLAVLAVFKYAREIASMLHVGGGTRLSRLVIEIALPVGVSYYVFKLVSYVIDVYWGDI